MTVLTKPILNRIEKIAQMEATTAEIEHAIKMLCLDVADHVSEEQHKSTLEALSFESLRKTLYPSSSSK